MSTSERGAPESAVRFHGVARGGAVNLVGALVSAGVNLLLVLIIARALPPSQAGAVFATTSLFLLVAAGARLGTDVSIVHFLAGARARDRPQDIVPYLRTALVPVVVIGALGAAVLALAGPGIIDVVLRETAVPHGRALMVILGLAVPVGASYDLLVGATRGLGTARPTVMLERFVRPALQVVFVAVALALGGGAFAVVCAWAAPYAIVVVLAVIWLRQLLPSSGSGSSAETAGIVDGFWRFTLPRSVAAMVQIALQRLDIVLVGILIGASAAAVYTASTRFVVVGQLGTVALWYAVQPRFAMLVAKNDLEGARRLYRISTAWLVALTWPLFLVSAVAAPVILRFFGPGYKSGANVMIFLSIAMMFSAACGLVDVVLITVGKTTWNLGNTVLALGVNLAIDLPLIPRVGIIGAAIGWAAAIIARNVVASIQIRRSFGFTPLSRLSLDVAALAVVCFGLLPGAAILALGSRTSVVVAAVAAGVLLYAAGIWHTRRRLHLDFLAAASAGKLRPPRTPQPASRERRAGRRSSAGEVAGR